MVLFMVKSTIYSSEQTTKSTSLQRKTTKTTVHQGKQPNTLLFMASGLKCYSLWQMAWSAALWQKALCTLQGKQPKGKWPKALHLRANSQKHYSIEQTAKSSTLQGKQPKLLHFNQKYYFWRQTAKKTLLFKVNMAKSATNQQYNLCNCLK